MLDCIILMLLQRVNYLAMISSRIKYLEALLKCALMEAIPECVMMDGITVMLQWCAVRLDSQDMVSVGLCFSILLFSYNNIIKGYGTVCVFSLLN